jgi:lipoprotein-anchoring transpeptidase ErfK/SrfK
LDTGHSKSLFYRQHHLSLTIIVLLFSVLLSACGGAGGSTQQQVQQHKATLDQLINQAQSIGVPQNLLQPIVDQENQLSSTSAPLTLLFNQLASDYYGNVSQRYRILSMQVKGLEAQVTQQFGYQATLDMQNFESVLSQRQSQGFIEAQTFADQLTQDQNMLDQAHYPKHFLEVSNNARNATLALRLMGPAFDQLTTLRTTIQQLTNSGLDVTALQQQEQYDLDSFRQANDPDNYQQLIDQINTQIQASTTLSTQAIPYVGEAKLNQFSASIEQMKQYQVDTTVYQKQLDNDRTALASASSINDYLKVSAQIDNDMQAASIPMLKGQATYLLKNYYQEVNTWGATHQYDDKFDGQSYILDYEYDQTHGFGSDLDTALQNAQTADDYQGAIDQINTMMLHLKAMEADAGDSAAYQLPHKTDQQLIAHYKLSSSNVIVVSMVEQALRFYQNGKLIKAFQVTTGQYDKPTPPGLWQIFVRQSPTIFKSWEPKGSAFWYPDTNINYAMEYRNDGYYFHDSWWRLDYGLGTNFPHVDSGGDQAFAGSGSHGCINMSKSLAAWLYQNTTYGTPAIIY